MRAMRHFLNLVAKRVASLGIARRKITERFFEYGISSGISTALEFIVLFTLVDFFDWHYLWAVAVAFFIKVTFLFFLTYYTAFRDKHPEKKTAYLKFFGIYLVNLALILTFMKVAVDVFDINYIVARAVTLIFMVFWSFWLNAKFNFKIIK